MCVVFSELSSDAAAPWTSIILSLETGTQRPRVVAGSLLKGIKDREAILTAGLRLPEPKSQALYC